MSHKLVSVIMALGHIDEFTFPAINSILNQTYENFELVIIANGASCISIKARLLEEFGDERIMVYTTPLQGLTNALNYGISKARGDYIARMDSDDLSVCNRLKVQVDYLESNKKIGVLGSRIDLIDENNDLLGDSFFYVKDDDKIRSILPIYNPMCHPALMFTRECLLEVGGYRYGFMSEDHELFLRIAEGRKWQFYNIDSVLLQYRRHRTQITSKNRTGKNFREISAFLYLHFLSTWNFKFLIGIVYVFPPIIVLKRFIRSIIRNYVKAK